MTTCPHTNQVSGWSETINLVFLALLLWTVTCIKHVLLHYYCLQHSCNILIDLPLYNVLISLLSECLYILWSSTIKTVLDIYSWSCYSASWQHYTDGGPPLTTADLRDAVILQLWGNVSTYTCVSHQLVVSVEWVGCGGGHSDGLW